MPLTLSRETMLAVMLAADRDYDGQFITGVVSTRIYCLPSCRARKPNPENVVFHASPGSARGAGLRPCQRCRPDDFYAGIHADEARVEALAATFDRTPAALQNVTQLARAAGVSPRKLHALFRLHLHTTPAEWLARRRVALARRLLLGTRRSVADIAFAVGFESLSTFGGHFRKFSAMTPRAYRALPQGAALELTLPHNYPLAAVLRDLGRDPQSLTSRVRGQTYTCALRLSSGPLVVRVTFTPGRALCTPRSPLDPQATDWLHLHGALLSVLGLASDPDRFEAQVAPQPDLAPLLDGQRGWRVPLVADPFDGLLWAVAGQQVTFGFACALRRRVVARTGQAVAEGLFAPPSPQAVAALDVSELRALGFTGARADTLRRAAQKVAEGQLSLSALAAGTASRAERTLLALPGIGPWSAHYVMLRALGFQDCVPLGDTALASELQRFFRLETRPDRRQTAALMARFRPHRSLATFHFWQRVQTRRMGHGQQGDAA